MKNSHKAYLALGSNQGDKIKHLQAAVNLIFKRIGGVVALSKVYDTPAVGFCGDNFLNACLLVETTLDPRVLIEELLKIETELGRKRKSGMGYESRTVDIDVLLYDDLLIESKVLTVPHPEMHNRKFVLQPLSDIAPAKHHPLFNKTTEQLLQECTDASNIQPVAFQLVNPLQHYKLSSFNYIAIEGNIGAGKTSLATKIAHDFNAKLILERFADNPFLPKFYKDPKRYAFTLEMSFLADRYQQITDDLAQLDLFKDFIVSDYDIFKSLIFSKITLPQDEFKLYRKLFYQMYKEIAKPELYVYLYQNTERLQQNIKKRGRDYEQNIKDDYLEQINAGYLAFLRNQPQLNIKLIDISDRDFVHSREDYLWVLEAISKVQ